MKVLWNSLWNFKTYEIVMKWNVMKWKRYEFPMKYYFIGFQIFIALWKNLWKNYFIWFEMFIPYEILDSADKMKFHRVMKFQAYEKPYEIKTNQIS